MSWLSEAMKDVASCDKPREVPATLIRRFLNGETHPFTCGHSVSESQLRGTETSKYLGGREKTIGDLHSEAASELEESPNRFLFRQKAG